MSKPRGTAEIAVECDQRITTCPAEPTQTLKLARTFTLSAERLTVLAVSVKNPHFRRTPVRYRDAPIVQDGRVLNFIQLVLRGARRFADGQPLFNPPLGQRRLINIRERNDANTRTIALGFNQSIRPLA
jgi:hypothetical protein